MPAHRSAAPPMSRAAIRRLIIPRPSAGAVPRRRHRFCAGRRRMWRSSAAPSAPAIRSAAMWGGIEVMLIKPLLAASAFAVAAVSCPLQAEVRAIATPDSSIHAGQLDVPLNKSQVPRADRPYAKALIGNPEIADVLPLTNRSLYVLGKTIGTTSLTLYDGNKNLIAVVDIVVGPDVITLRRQLAE